MVCSGKTKVAGKRKQGRTACPKARLRGVYAPAEFRHSRNVRPRDFVYKPGRFMQRRTTFCEKNNRERIKENLPERTQGETQFLLLQRP